MTPKIHIISANATGEIDPTIMGGILNHLPNRVTTLADADVVLVPISWYNEFRFNKSLMGVTKPVVVMDFMEVYGNKPDGGMVFGRTEAEYCGWQHWIDRNASHASCRGYEEMDSWASSPNIKFQFIRELHESERTDGVAPIEWPCLLPAWEIEDKANFDRRPFEVLFNWGMSNPIRPRLHGQIYQLMGEGEIDVIGHWDHIEAKINDPHPKWLSIHTPHTHRIPINDIARRQAQSKVTISLPGAGSICFRHTEAPVHSVPAFLEEGVARSFKWDQTNSITLLDGDDMARFLNEAVFGDGPDLHAKYVAAQETIDRYRTPRYINEYIMPHIERALS